MARDDDHERPAYRHATADQILKAAAHSFGAVPAPELRARPVMAATTVQRVMTPFGETRISHNAQAAADMKSVRKTAQLLASETMQDAQQVWRARKLLKTFERAKALDKSNSIDLER